RLPTRIALLMPRAMNCFLPGGACAHGGRPVGSGALQYRRHRPRDRPPARPGVGFLRAAAWGYGMARIIPAPFCLPEPTDLAQTAPLPDLAAIQALAADDMAGIDALIRRRLASDVVLINQVAEHIISAGGKRLRPMLVALAGRACGGHGPEHHQLAAIIEFIHTSTLLHDDVIDESDLRRGRSTANAIWGNAASVLVGDFLYSRSFQLMVELDRMEVMQVLADTTNRIAEGEVLQLLHVRNPDVDEAGYLGVIERKTAVLFAAGTRLGALASGADQAIQQRLHDYGLQLGHAFQIADDMLDYAA